MFYRTLRLLGLGVVILTLLACGGGEDGNNNNQPVTPGLIDFSITGVPAGSNTTITVRTVGVVPVVKVTFNNSLKTALVTAVTLTESTTTPGSWSGQMLVPNGTVPGAYYPRVELQDGSNNLIADYAPGEVAGTQQLNFFNYLPITPVDSGIMVWPLQVSGAVATWPALTTITATPSPVVRGANLTVTLTGTAAAVTARCYLSGPGTTVNYDITLAGASPVGSILPAPGVAGTYNLDCDVWDLGYNNVRYAFNSGANYSEMKYQANNSFAQFGTTTVGAIPSVTVTVQ